MVAVAKNKLGSGLYTIPEAALYARVSPRRLARWLFGNENGAAVIRPQFGPKERLVSFLDFVQAVAVREIRIQKRVPLTKIRRAIKMAKEQFGMDYPFARMHCTFLWGDEVVIRPPGEGLVEASEKHRGQRLFPFVEVYLHSLSFAPEGLANLYRVYTCENSVPLVMNPQVRFGEPLLPSGYSALSIWEAIKAEGGLEGAAKAYGIPLEEAEAVYKFFVSHLGETRLVTTSARFLFDECLGKPMMEQLLKLPAPDTPQFIHLCDLSARGTPDSEWIPDIANQGSWIVNSTDRGKQSGTGDKLPKLCREYKVTHVLFSPGLHKRPGRAKLAALVLAWEKIRNLDVEPPGSRFVLRLKESKKDGGFRVALDAAPAAE